MSRKQNISLALFDIRPKKSSEVLDVETHTQIPRQIDLRTGVLTDYGGSPLISAMLASAAAGAHHEDTRPAMPMNAILASAPIASSKELLAREIEAELTSMAIPPLNTAAIPSDEPLPVEQPEAISGEPVDDTPPTTAEQHAELERFWKKSEEKVAEDDTQRDEGAV